jgi:hypothetical protein
MPSAGGHETNGAPPPDWNIYFATVSDEKLRFEVCDTITQSAWEWNGRWTISESRESNKFKGSLEVTWKRWGRE